MNTTRTNLEALQNEIDRLTAENDALRAAVAPVAKPARKPATCAAKIVAIRDISDRARKSHGVTYPGRVEAGQNADIVVNKSIRLFGFDANHRAGGTSYDQTFTVGGRAVYGSYNLIYTGTIVKIGAKTVTIDTGHGGSMKRLSLYEFNFCNKHFDAERIDAHNDTEMQCI